MMRLACLLLVLASGASASCPQDSAAVPVTGDAVAGLEPFDELMMSFVRKHDVPGASLAIGRRGKILYARGFGVADRESGQLVMPDSRFRIASISKPFTAVAILQLVERGELSLDDLVFEVLELGKDLEEHAVDPRLAEITIDHLLQHRGGWDRQQSFDPMFIYDRVAEVLGTTVPPSHEDLIRYMIRQPLQFAPGERVAYSNFGYCLLGRVIEQKSGQTYEAFVRESILEPLGIESMQIGASLPEQRADGEVTYYDPHGRVGAPVRAPDRQVPAPYLIDHEVMDSHGGWIATASDLVHFALALDHSSRRRVLKQVTVHKMFEPPSGSAGYAEDGSVLPSYYARGWLVRPVGNGRANTWHGGLLMPGTSTLLVRRHDGLHWAVLFNCHGSETALTLAGAIDPLLHRAAARVERWPKR